MGLVLCSVPVFFKIPGQANRSMGDHTESKLLSFRCWIFTF
jgi:ATP-binding cassette subfamily D (ALD) long-chain fatty acid import protein